MAATTRQVALTIILSTASSMSRCMLNSFMARGILYSSPSAAARAQSFASGTFRSTLLWHLSSSSSSQQQVLQQQISVAAAVGYGNAQLTDKQLHMRHVLSCAFMCFAGTQHRTGCESPPAMS